MFINIIDILKNNVKVCRSKIAFEDEERTVSWGEVDEVSDIIAKNIPV